MPEFSWSQLDTIYEDEDMYECMCASARASDFIFNVQDIDGMTTIAIVPKEYFKEEGHMWDQHLPIDHLLPDDMSEEMECTWSSERDVDSVRKDMLQRGFEEDPEFDAFLKDENFDGS